MSPGLNEFRLNLWLSPALAIPGKSGLMRSSALVGSLPWLVVGGTTALLLWVGTVSCETNVHLHK